MVLKIIIILLSLLNAGYMAFDGGRALIVGDYIRPKAGAYAGQLGPWTKIVSAIGIDPMSTLMKCIFLLIGIYGVIAALCFAFNVSAGWKMLLVFCILSIWNLMFGTMSCVLVILFMVMWKWKYALQV
jgi:hypothetical protein